MPKGGHYHDEAGRFPSKETIEHARPDELTFVSERRKHLVGEIDRIEDGDIAVIYFDDGSQIDVPAGKIR